LLNPGPTGTSPRVEAALRRGDLCHREPECAELMAGILAKLLAALGATETHRAVLLAGSGTAAVEACVGSAVRPGRRLAVVRNGVYGDRIAEIARRLRITTVEIHGPWVRPPDHGQIEAALEDPRVDALAVVHHETTTGLLNPLSEIGAIARAADKPLLVDGVSSLAIEEVDLAAVGADFVACGANKGFHSYPGVSFALLSERACEHVAAGAPRSLYLDLGTYLYHQHRDDVPFTPAIQTLYAFDEALDELTDEGGISARAALYRRRAQVVRAGIASQGLDFLLDKAYWSSSITAVRLPSGLTYADLHDALKSDGFIIYAGQGNLQREIFRVANMGFLPLSELERFNTSLARVLSSALAGVSS
jgi:2-aminoethylphosphonate-pyruvate transaminase